MIILQICWDIQHTFFTIKYCFELCYFQYKKGSQGSLDLMADTEGIDLLCQVDAKPKAANYR